MSPIIHRANQRGISELGWLSSRFSFSFADYHNSERMGFGVLRVINDDRIDAGTGFGMHPHRDMEIVTIVTKGALEHRDSEGNHGIIHAGEIQYMCAGSGVYHSEHAMEEDTELFQIWIFPNAHGHAPRYEQRDFRHITDQQGWHTLISADGRDNSILIHQDASIQMIRLSQNEIAALPEVDDGHGILLLIVEGKISIDGAVLERRDEIQLIDNNAYSIEALEDAQMLLFDVSMIKR